MKMHIICVRDRSADVFGQPNFVLSIGAAVRNFTDEINREAPDNIMNRHPADFDLYDLGMYDDNNASFECGPPRQIAVGKDLIVKKK